MVIAPRKLVLVVGVALLFASCATSADRAADRATGRPSGRHADQPDDSAAVAATLQTLIRERLDAAGRRDAVAWARYVDDDCVCGGSTKSDTAQAIASRPASIKNWYGDIGRFSAHVHGDVALVRYQVTEFTEIGGQRIALDEWRTETFLRRGESWVLLGGADVVVPRDPPVATVDARLYDRYVGRYEYTPGLIDTVTRQGERLFIQSTGQEKEELFPESEGVFFAKGQDWRVVFESDDRDAVVRLRFRQNGQDLVAKRVP